MEYCENYNLKNHSTLKIGPVNAKVVYIDKKEDIEQSLEIAKKQNLIPYPLGGGSNTVFSDSVVDKYLFLIPRMSSIKLFGKRSDLKNSERSDLEENSLITIDAGLEWDKAVEQTVEMDLSGLEALSWIPGLVGASPVQNIGAYGAEVKDSIHTVHTYDFREKKFVDFSNEECEFEYRNSIFKKSPGRYFIYAVTFSLLKISAKARPSVPQYKDVISYFETRNIISPTLKEIRESIIEIRKAKLPNPLETPNAGSYFGNPIVSKEKAEILLQKFPSMPMFDFEPSSSVTPTSLSFPWRRESMDQEYFSSEKSPDHNSTCQSPSLRLETLPSSPRIRKDDKQEYKKLFAGWLIDKAGLKGYENNNFSIHKDHALVIIGNEKGTLSELLEFESYIKQKVFEIFGVELEREPVIVN